MQEPGSGAPARLDDAGTPPATQAPASQTLASQAPAIRASDRERDAATQRLQQAFAEGRLDDSEFDQRMRTALSARTRPELDRLLEDLPQPGPPAGPPATAGRPPGRLAVAFKSSVRRAGRWRVPERYRTVVYKGSGWLDLRAAELTAAETTLLTVAYKSHITILVPPGVPGRGQRFRRRHGHRGRPGAARRCPGAARARVQLQGHHPGPQPPAGKPGPGAGRQHLTPGPVRAAGPACPRWPGFPVP